jgi:hypothetical protein
MLDLMADKMANTPQPNLVLMLLLVSNMMLGLITLSTRRHRTAPSKACGLSRRHCYRPSNV